MIGQCPQEGAQLLEVQLPHPPPVEVLPIFPEKADKSRSILTDLHAGQQTQSASSRFRQRTSKIFLHFRHLNSNIGMDPFLGMG
jgi:hypothetical protein